MVMLGFLLPYPEISVIIAIHYFFGYFGIFWGTFMAGKWIQIKGEFTRTELEETLQTKWLVSGIILLLIAVFILLPTLNFS